MSTPQEIATVRYVTTNKGAELKARREAIGISLREFAEKVGHSRGSIAKIEAGETVRGQYEIIGRMDEVLTEIEHEFGMDLPSQVEKVTTRPIGDPEDDLFEVAFGEGQSRVVVKGPVSDPAAFAELVERIMRARGNPDQ